MISDILITFDRLDFTGKLLETQISETYYCCVYS
jgi:hypothetical protein